MTKTYDANEETYANRQTILEYLRAIYTANGQDYEIYIWDFENNEMIKATVTVDDATGNVEIPMLVVEANNNSKMIERLGSSHQII